MPELPDVTVYIEALERRIAGQTLQRVRLANPFVLRTVEPSIADVSGRKIVAVRRMGKRIVLVLEGDVFIIIHLMIAGRFRWLAPAAKIPGKLGLAAFDFANGTLLLTEAGSKRRASIHIVRGEDAVREEYRQEFGISRFGKVEDLGSLIAFLASSHGRWLHGATIDIDGGEVRSV